MPDGSRVRRESHARFCERLVVQSHRPTHPHICETKADGSGFQLWRKTIRKRLKAKVREIKEEL